MAGICHFRRRQDGTCTTVVGFCHMHCSLVRFLSGWRILFKQFYSDFQHLILQIISMLLKKMQTLSPMIAFNRIYELGGPGDQALSLIVSWQPWLYHASEAAYLERVCLPDFWATVPCMAQRLLLPSKDQELLFSLLHPVSPSISLPQSSCGTWERLFPNQNIPFCRNSRELGFCSNLKQTNSHTLRICHRTKNLFYSVNFPVRSNSH